MITRCLIAVLLLGAPTVAQEAPAPAGFPEFVFSGDDASSRVLSAYLWRHFSQRLGNGLTLFNKEYLTVADLWMGGAIEPREQRPIQAVHREHLLAIQFDEEGYVQTHQHFSHAHDHGWPFPLWTQSGRNLGEVRGKTAGWHFQPLDDVPGWVKGHLRNWGDPTFYGEGAAAAWELENARSLGIEDKRWVIESTGESAALLTPPDARIEAFQAPYVQLRWKRSGEAIPGATPYIEWQREGDTGWSADRRAYFYADTTPLSGAFLHSIVQLYDHPEWQGTIQRIRIVPAPGEADTRFEIDSFFTLYDTRHTINNPIFILASDGYFRWTGDFDFLRKNINRMRLALRYQQTVMGGLEHNRIRNPWPGHGGRPGWTKDAEGTITVLGGRGVGNNYWDLLPFGHDDFYATYQYYAATLAMADLEAAILRNPGWQIPRGAMAFDPDTLRDHAAAVKHAANDLFWNPETGRFYASIDQEGNAYDYGFTFVNLDAIWYGIASEEHAASILDWISGERIVAGDTSQGQDIYHWRFGPRATTRRNVEWYGQGWYHPENIPWGGQVQDGGAVLGFSFHDLWARLQMLGPDDAWTRLQAIVDWEKEVAAAGGYRPFYADGKQGTTLQGGGTAGGIGIDYEFFESSLLPAIVPYGFLGLHPTGEALEIRPRVPAAIPEIGIKNVLYHNTRLDIFAGPGTLRISVAQQPIRAITLILEGAWTLEATGEKASAFTLTRPGEYRFGQR